LILVWLPEALRNRFEQLDYIAQDNPLAAADQDEEIEHQVDLLLQNPKMGRPGRMQGTRELVISRSPFIAGVPPQGDSAHRDPSSPAWLAAVATGSNSMRIDRGDWRARLAAMEARRRVFQGKDDQNARPRKTACSASCAGWVRRRSGVKNKGLQVIRRII